MDKLLPEPSSATAAFETLAQIVARFFANGRSTRSAAIKPALRAATDPPFDEKELGFGSFRRFLEAAQESGVVVLRPASTGPDVDVLPPGTTLAPVGASERHSVDRIRSDLWRAFTRWGAGNHRLWDRQTSQAFVVAPRPFPGEDADDAAIRSAWLTNPDRFVAIEQITVETLIGWMAELVAELPDQPKKRALETALKAERPVREFVILVRQLGLGANWHKRHVTKVREVIRTWEGLNELQIDLEAEPLTNITSSDLRYTNTSTRSLVDGGEPGSIDVSDIRRRVHLLVDQMTVIELLSVSVPFRFFV